MAKSRKIALLTGGGDCPGINAVIRAVTKKAILEQDMEVVGFEDGYEGVIQNRHRQLRYDEVSGILTLGGTILGTSKTANPYSYAIEGQDEAEFEDVSRTAIENIQSLEIECLVCIGGDGTLSVAHKLHRDGVPILGVPKTIDNDLRGTDITFGFDSAVAIATEGIDRIHSTAQSHHRVMVIEVMGNRAGWLALHSGIAGGGDVIVIPEIPYDTEIIAEKVRERSKKGKRFSIVVVAEGAKPLGGEVVVQRTVKSSTEPMRLGGIGFVLASQIEDLTGIETRTVVMGHLQRGGSPTAFDRVLATRLGTRAVDYIQEKRFGYMIGVRGDALVPVTLEEVAIGPKTVSPNDPLVQVGRDVGTCFGN